MRSQEELEAELDRLDAKDAELERALGKCGPAAAPPFGEILDLRAELAARLEVIQWALGMHERAPSAIEAPLSPSSEGHHAR